MISFTVITDTPGRLATFLESRGIIEKRTNLITGEEFYAGVVRGMEWVRVPNPIETAVTTPPTYDTRAVFMVKFAHESEAQKMAGFRDWVLANSSVVTAPAEWTLRGEPVGDARKINGEQVWLVHDRPERFGVWQ
jgi:hypothetical protein